MAMISESACKAQLRHHNRQDVVIYTALLIHVLPNAKLEQRRVNRNTFTRPARALLRETGSITATQ